jgi:DNA-binding transcriptional ArsR family regulator
MLKVNLKYSGREENDEMARPAIEQDDLFMAIAHPLRRAVLKELKRKETPATQLAARFGVTPSALSQHLKTLREAGLVIEERSGRQRIYALSPARLKEVSDWVDEFAEFWPKSLEALGDHLRKKGKR